MLNPNSEKLVEEKKENEIEKKFLLMCFIIVGIK